MQRKSNTRNTHRYLAGYSGNLNDGHACAVREDQAHLEQDLDLVLQLLLVVVAEQFRAVPSLHTQARKVGGYWCSECKLFERDKRRMSKLSAPLKA